MDLEPQETPSIKVLMVGRLGEPIVLSGPTVPAPGQRPGVGVVHQPRPHEAPQADAGGRRRQGGRGACTRAELDAGDGGANPATGSTAAIAAGTYAATGKGMAPGTAADVQ